MRRTRSAAATSARCCRTSSAGRNTSDVTQGRARLTPGPTCNVRWAMSSRGLSKRGVLAVSLCLAVVAAGLMSPSMGAGSPDRVPLIVGGEPAPPGAYPWAAALVFKDEPAEEGNYCGATLIKPKVVLTAAHCVEGFS